MYKRFVLLFVLFAGLAVAGGEYKRFGAGSNGVTAYVTLPLVETGDTAQIMAMTVSAGIDSFAYIDTFVVGSGGADSVEIAWTSPITTYTLTFGLDTAITYRCSVAFAAQTVGFTLDPSGLDADIDSIIDWMMDSINAVTGFADSMTADTAADHGSVVVVADFAQITFGSDNRPTLIVGDSMHVDSSITTVAMWCDSIVAALNASSAATELTAADSTDSIYVTSDDRGLGFAIYYGDTATDTASAQANVTSWSSASGYQILGAIEGYSTIYGRIILNPGRDSYTGLGNVDSAYLWLYSRRFGNVRKLIDSSFRAALPCTLTVVKPQGVGDTLLTGDLELGWRLTDTASDTTLSVNYPWVIDITLK